MEGRETRSKAKAGTSKIPNNPVTTSKRRRHVGAIKLNKKQRTEEQNVCVLNLQDQNGEDHNIEEPHNAHISFHTSEKPCNLVTTSERSRRVKARKPNKNQQTVNELNVKEQNEEQNIKEQNAEEHNVEEQHAAHTSFVNSKRPCNPVTKSERSIRVKARKPDRKQRAREQSVNELYVEKQNVEQNIEEQKAEEHIVEEQHTAYISLVTASKRSRHVKANKLNKKQRSEEENADEQNVEEENAEVHNVKEQNTCDDVGTSSSRYNAQTACASKRSRHVKAIKLNKKQQSEEENADEQYMEEENADEQNVEKENAEEHNVKEQNTCDDVGTSSARYNAQTACASMPLSTEDTSIQHEQETISASIQREQETISTPVQHEHETRVNQQVVAKKSIEFNRHGEAVGPNATHFMARVGRFVKKLIPVSYTTWKMVPQNYKDDVWNEIVKEFEVPSYMKKNVQNSMPSPFRKFKHSLRKYHLDKQPNLEARMLDIPTGIKKEDWEIFCINESSEKQMKRRNQAIQSKKKSPYAHTQGRKSASMIEHEMIAKGNHSITRTDVWLAQHIRKDGTVLPSAKPFVEKVKAKVDEFKRSGGSASGHLLSIDDDPLAQVLGKKKVLPGIGSNVSKSKYEATLIPHIMCSKERAQREALEKKLNKMEAQIDFIINHYTPQAARGPSTPTTTVVVDDGSSASAAAKNPLLLEENSVQSKSADSIPDARMCELFDWNRKCVAVAKEVTDPIHKAICHGYQLKTEYEMKVSMCEPKIPNTKLYKETSDAKKIKDVGVGDFLVWPMSHISFLESEK